MLLRELENKSFSLIHFLEDALLTIGRRRNIAVRAVRFISIVTHEKNSNPDVIFREASRSCLGHTLDAPSSAPVRSLDAYRGSDKVKDYYPVTRCH